MGFCKRKNTECECLSETSTCNTNNCHRKLPDISFRENLTLQADEYEKNIDIQKDVETIKRNLNAYYYRREYTISLYKVIRGSLALGQGTPGCIALFIPRDLPPLYYRQLFINEFSKLGFTEDCMELDEQEHRDFHKYSIILKW